MINAQRIPDRVLKLAQKKQRHWHMPLADKDTYDKTPPLPRNKLPSRINQDSDRPPRTVAASSHSITTTPLLLARQPATEILARRRPPPAPVLRGATRRSCTPRLDRPGRASLRMTRLILLEPFTPPEHHEEHNHPAGPP